MVCIRTGAAFLSAAFECGALSAERAGRKSGTEFDRRPVYLLLGMLALGTIAVAWPVFHLWEFHIPLQLGFAAITTVVMFTVAYWLFGVDQVRSLLWERVAARFLRGELIR